MGSAVLLALLVTLVFYKRRVHDSSSYPSYDKVPATILTHMPTTKDLAELDHAVDVIVSVHGGAAAELWDTRFLTQCHYDALVNNLSFLHRLWAVDWEV